MDLSVTVDATLDPPVAVFVQTDGAVACRLELALALAEGPGWRGLTVPLGRRCAPGEPAAADVVVHVGAPVASIVSTSHPSPPLWFAGVDAFVDLRGDLDRDLVLRWVVGRRDRLPSALAERPQRIGPERPPGIPIASDFWSELLRRRGPGGCWLASEGDLLLEESVVRDEIDRAFDAAFAGRPAPPPAVHSGAYPRCVQNPNL